VKEQLIDIYENAKRRGATPNRIDQKEELLNVHFVGQPFVEIYGEINNNDYEITFIDKDNGKLIYQQTIKINHWVRVNRKWFVNYQVKIYKNNKPLYLHDYNAKGKRVYIHLDSKSLGDTIAWFPYVEEFRKIHQCEMICSTFWNKLFEKEYPEIKFVEPLSIVANLYAMYTIGVNPNESYKNKNDYRTIPLQQVASDMLGLDFFEIRPKISVVESLIKKPKKPYVCMSKHSTAQAKYWNNPHGWQNTINHLVECWYEVVSIAKEGCDLENVTVIKDKSIQEVIDILDTCEFFVGLPSGLTWLAWALGKKVVMISGFSKPWYEFTENNYYVQNNNPGLCTGCFVDSSVKFDKGDWNWCPRHKNSIKQFECTQNITSQMVIKKINEIIENRKSLIDVGILKPTSINLLEKEMKFYNIYGKYFEPKNNDIIVDLGACIGLYALFSLKGVNFNKCYCVEPFPKNISALKNNILLLKHSDKIEVVEYAIDDDIEDASFSINSDWTASIKKVNNKSDIKINVLKFKEFLNKFNINHIDILKMDIEGSEYSVLSKKENLDIIKDIVVNMTGEIHFDRWNYDQKIDIINSMLYLKDNGFTVIFNSVDNVDITKRVFENKIVSGKKSFDYYKQFLFYCMKKGEK